MTSCPGCGLEMPQTTRPLRENYYNCSRECWSVHLAGLYLVLRDEKKPVDVAPMLQMIATNTKHWPHLELPTERAAMTIADIALATSMTDHIELVRRWATQVFSAWSQHHDAIAALISTGRRSS